MLIKTVQIHNIAGCRDLTFDMTGHHLFLIGGENAQGKSSAIHALVMALAGKRGCEWHSRPLRQGEDEGFVKVTTTEGLTQSGLEICRTFKRKESGDVTDELVITSADGFEAPTPQKLLNDLYKLHGFDPLEFLNLKAKDQIDILKGMLKVDLDAIDAKIKAAYDERTDANKEVKRHEGAFALMKLAEDAPEKEADPSEIMGRMKAANTYNAQLDTLKVSLVNQQANVSSIDSKKVTAEDKIRELNESKSEKQKEVDRLLAEIKAIDGRITKGREYQGDLDSERSPLVKLVEQTQTAIDSFKKIDVEPIEEELKNVETVNEKIRNNEKYHQAKINLELARSKAKELDEKVKAAELERVNAIKDADWPDYMSFNDKDGVVLNGLPINSCSTSEKLILSAHIGMKMNPELKLMVIQRGESLNQASLEDLEAIAKKHGYAILVEYVCHNEADMEKCQVVIENGARKNGT